MKNREAESTRIIRTRSGESYVSKNMVIPELMVFPPDGEEPLDHPEPKIIRTPQGERFVSKNIVIPELMVFPPEYIQK